MRLRHARHAHLLRDRSACYTRSDLDLDIAALASEAGGQRGNSIVRASVARPQLGSSPPSGPEASVRQEGTR